MHFHEGMEVHRWHTCPVQHSCRVLYRWRGPTCRILLRLTSVLGPHMGTIGGECRTCAISDRCRRLSASWHITALLKGSNAVPLQRLQSAATYRRLGSASCMKGMLQLQAASELHAQADC